MSRVENRCSGFSLAVAADESFCIVASVRFGCVTRTIVCLFREPDAGNPPVRFDEREQETEPRRLQLLNTTRGG